MLVSRIQYLIEEEGLKPSGIVALTFTRAAAAEMRERLEERLGLEARQVRVSTLHSFALRELLRHGARNLPEPVRVVSDWEERAVVEEELGTLLNRKINSVRASLRRLEDDWNTLEADGWEAGHPDPEFLEAWKTHRLVYGYTLRSELVYQLLQELRLDPGFEPSTRISALLVDEYQDLNKCDLETIRLLVERTGADLFAVGDDDQSIYSFRGAHPAGIREFRGDYEEASILEMSECHRCGAEVVHLSNWLIKQEAGRIDKELVSITDWPSEIQLIRFPNPAAEAAGVARIIANEVDRGGEPENILVLVRSDFHNRIAEALYEALDGTGIGLYLPRASEPGDEVVRLLEYLLLSLARAEEMTDDLALRALLELEENGIGSTRIWRIVELAMELGLRFSEAMERVRDEPDSHPARLQAVVAERDRLVAIADGLQHGEDEPHEAWLSRVADALSFSDQGREQLARLFTQAEAEVRDELDEPEGDGEQVAEPSSGPEPRTT